MKQIVCTTGTDIAGLVFAYATKTKNESLKQQVNYSRTDLDRIKDDLLLPTITNIYNAANTNLAALATYGITAAMLTALQTALNNYSAAVPKPQTAKATKATENANIAALIKEIDGILKNEMDKLVVAFKAVNSSFVTTYFNSRVIIDPASHSKQPIPPTEQKS